MRSSFSMRYLLLVAIVQGIITPSSTITGVIWNKDQGKFVPIFDVPAFAEIHRKKFLESRSTEIHNFQGQIFKFSYFEEMKQVEFKANDTISGLYGELWNTLSEVLNFTLQPVIYEERAVGQIFANGTFTDLLDLIKRKEIDIIPRLEMHIKRLGAVDYTVPFWNTWHLMYVSGNKAHNSTWVLKLFSWKVWCCIVLVHLSVTIFGFWSLRIYNARNSAKKETATFGEHCFYNFAMMCNQNFIPSVFDGRSRMLELSFGLFASLIYIAFSTLLFTYITQKVFRPPFWDLFEFLAVRSYKVVIFKGSVADIAFQYGRTKPLGAIKAVNRVEYVSLPDEIFEKVCSKTKQYVMLVEEDLKKVINSPKYCPVNPLKTRYFPFWIAGGLIKDLQNKKSFDVGLMKMREFGIIDALRGHWMEPKDMDTLIKDEPEPISMDQLKLVFAVFWMGALAAIFIFIVERTIFYINRKHKCS